MRSLLSKTTAVVAAGFLLFSLFAVPAASAQDPYPAPAPTAVITASVTCANPAPTISIDGTDVVVAHSTADDACITNLDVEINPTIYNGPPSVFGVIRRPIPGNLVGGDHTATVTASYSDGSATKSASVKISAAALAAARARSGAPASVPAVAVPVPALAFTGSTASLPAALGATLVGAGGLALLFARKREHAQG